MSKISHEFDADGDDAQAMTIPRFFSCKAVVLTNRQISSGTQFF